MSVNDLPTVREQLLKSVQDFKDVLKYLEMGDSINDIDFGDGGGGPGTGSLKSIRLKPPSSAHGPMGIFVELCKKNPVKAKSVLGRTPAQRALVHQWMDYNLSNLINNPSPGPNCLRELDTALLTSTFIAANTLTVADMMIYCSLYGLYKDLSLKDKEKYANLSRWFRLVQEYDQLRGPDRAKLIFTRKPLYNGASVSVPSTTTSRSSVNIPHL